MGFTLVRTKKTQIQSILNLFRKDNHYNTDNEETVTKPWLFLYLANKVFLGVYMYHPVCLPVYISPECKLILMKLQTVVLYDMSVCIKEDNPGPNYSKGDNWVCLVYYLGIRVSYCDLTHSSSWNRQVGKVRSEMGVNIKIQEIWVLGSKRFLLYPLFL